ncbi:Error-prone DNA polymerase [Castellaniella caeni]
MTMSSASPSFVHLRSHSEFSVVDSIARIPDLIKRAKAFGQPAMALTDLCNLFGWIKFYRAARKAGIKPVAGSDVWLHNPDDTDKPFRVLLLAPQHAAYLHLCQLLSRAWIEGGQRGRAEIRREWLSGASGIIVLSGARAGDVGCALEAGREDEAARLARQWAADFPGNYFIELQRAGFDGDEAYVQAALRLAAQCGVPVVATHPIQFIEPSDFRAHEARVCIAEGELLGNPRRVRRFTAEQYMPDTDEMARRFADVPSALANTVQIARRCNLTLTLGHPELPLFPTPDGVSLDDYMVHLANEGLQRRMAQLYPDAAERARQMPTYQERLDRECQTIVKMGFPGYFLIVQDFINWGKGHGVPVGPGRGSGPARWWPSAWASPTSTPCATTCCSNAFSIPSGSPCPTSTSISARTTANASSSTSKKNTAAMPSARSLPSARWAPRPWCATWAGCSKCPIASATTCRR